MASFRCNGELVGRLPGTQHCGLLRVSSLRSVSPEPQTLVTAAALALIQSGENVGINLLQENLNMFSKQWPRSRGERG